MAECSNKECLSLCAFSGDNLDIHAKVSQAHFVLLITLYAFSQQCTPRNQSALRIYTIQPIRISVKALGAFRLVNILNSFLGFQTNGFKNGVNYLWGREKLWKLVKKSYIGAPTTDRHLYSGINSYNYLACCKTFLEGIDADFKRYKPGVYSACEFRFSLKWKPTISQKVYDSYRHDMAKRPLQMSPNGTKFQLADKSCLLLLLQCELTTDQRKKNSDWNMAKTW